MKKPLTAFILSLLLFGCSDIFETDISGSNVVIIAPTDNAEVQAGDITFLWNIMEGAEKYRLTIVSPDFKNAAIPLKDTIVYSDSLSISHKICVRLCEANYQWRIQALNQAYESAKSVYDLVVTPEKIDKKTNNTENPQ